MVYAVRQYIKGVKGSGTQDLWVGDYIPKRQELVDAFGLEGKFVVMERGKGIRGMRKVAEYGVSPSKLSSSNPPSYRPISSKEWMPKMFAAENSLSVRKEIKLAELSDEELDGLWTSMLDTPVESDEDFDRFVDDNAKLRDEVNRRLNDRTPSLEGDTEDEEGLQVQAAESGGMGYGVVVTAGVVGLVAGAVLQEVRWKRRMDEAEVRIRKLEEMLESLENNAEKKAAEQRAVAAGGGSLSTHSVLQAFNARSGF